MIQQESRLKVADYFASELWADLQEDTQVSVT